MRSNIKFDARKDRIIEMLERDGQVRVTQLAELLGVSERTVRRSLDQLKDDQLIWWRKATYKGANRYFLHERITQELRKQ